MCPPVGKQSEKRNWYVLNEVEQEAEPLLSYSHGAPSHNSSIRATRYKTFLHGPKQGFDVYFVMNSQSSKAFVKGHVVPRVIVK